MIRYIQKWVEKDLERKIILVSGPRQVGKTTFAKNLKRQFAYLNWDAIEDRPLMLKKKWDRSADLVIFDEIHKMKNFKSWLKGIFDKEGVKPPIIVTGSARLDIARKMGDSLAGRFFPFRLYPLDLWELKGKGPAPELYQRLLTCSGFPEPYFEGSETFYNRWSRSHLDLILRQDLLDWAGVRDLSSIETLTALLQERVGSTVSYSSLARDLGKDPKTIRSWLMLLENLFVIFKITPYHRNVARSLVKEPKYYFFDIARVKGDEGQKFENLVALSLKKQLDFLADTSGIFGNLHFIRTRDGKEVDFFIHWENPRISPLLLEAKLSDSNLAPSLIYFKDKFKQVKVIQLVKNLQSPKKFPSGEQIQPALKWLTEMDLVFPV